MGVPPFKKRILIMANTTTNNTSNNATTIQSHKSRNDNYYVVYKTGKMKTEKINKSMSTCAEIKSFIKKIRADKIKMLHIYKSDEKTACRLSAWVN